MNILFLTLANISSIESKGLYNDLLREFRNNGHDIYVVSPFERKEKKSTCLLLNNEVKILKVKIWNIQKTNLLEKGFSTLTISKLYKKAIKRHFDRINFDLILYVTPPITLLSAIKYLKKRYSATTYLLLKDIFPQNALDLGILNKQGVKGFIYRYFRMIEKTFYLNSDYIGCMSKANVEFLLKNNTFLDSSNIEICPNSITPSYIVPDLITIRNLKKKYSIPENKTIFLYGGNLGRPQSIEYIIECLKLNEKNEDSYILIVGFGTEYNKILEYFINSKPTNSKLISQLPNEEYSLLTYACDIGLIFLDHRFRIPNIPSRLLSYMEAEMPVIAATDVNTDLKDIIEDGKFGYWCESKDPNDFNQLVKKLSNNENLKEMGTNARIYLENNYTSKHSYNIIMNHFKHIGEN
jgi:glycosyltransferase involved in cell wall biosynthesis